MNHPVHEWDQQREQLSALLDNELPAQERSALEAHLQGCDWCRNELESLRRTRALLRALPQPALPRSFTLPLEPATASLPQRSAPALRPTPAPVAAQRPPRLPARSTPARRRPVQVLRWLSAIAAVLGIVVLLSGVFSTITSSGGFATSAPKSNRSQEGTQNTGGTGLNSPTHSPRATPPIVTGAETPAPTSDQTTATPGPTQNATPAQGGTSDGSSSSPLGQIISTLSIGLALLLLSACGFVTAWVLRRR